jgi:hypothetical protein
MAHYVLNLLDLIPIKEVVTLPGSMSPGALLPTSAPPPDDATWDAIIQTFTKQVTGLPGNLVRPRWQPIAPRMPEPNVNWVAVGYINENVDPNPAIVHQNINGVQSDVLIRHERITARASFYGPNAQQYAKLFRDQLYFPQNIAILSQYNAGMTTMGDISTVPELRNQQWVKRYDFTFTLSRQIIRQYLTYDLLYASFYGVAEDPGQVIQGEVPANYVPSQFLFGVDNFFFQGDGLQVNGFLYNSDTVTVDGYSFQCNIASS